VPDNAAVDALLLVVGLGVLVLLALVPAMYVRTGPRLPDTTRRRRAEALVAALATAPARRDGAVDARRMVWESGRNGRERYQVVRELVDRDWAEPRGRAGLTLMPAFLRLTSAGWWEWSYRQAEARAERQPTPTTVTYLSFGRLVPAGRRAGERAGNGTRPGEGDDGGGGVLVNGPSEQHLRELYVALRSDAENILARGLRQDALDRADEVEQAVHEPDPKKRWAVVDRVGPLVALDYDSFTLTVMVLKRLLAA
jgi:hypothetical protein